MSQHSSRANLAAIYYTLGNIGPCHNIAQEPSLLLLRHFGHIGPCHNITQEPVLLLFAILGGHWTMSQHRSRANLAAICNTWGTLDHVTT
eukprot:8953523-Karenia_brevis.AAC.1